LSDDDHPLVPPRAETDLTHPLAQPRAEQFDALVRELIPKIRELQPHLSNIEVLRAAARMAEDRLYEDEGLVWGARPRLR
jgi:hypothetical protein